MHCMRIGFVFNMIELENLLEKTTKILQNTVGFQPKPDSFIYIYLKNVCSKGTNTILEFNLILNNLA